MAAKKKPKGGSRTGSSVRSHQVLPQDSHRSWWTPLRVFWGGVVAFGVVVGLLAGLATFLPRVSLETSNPSNRADPFSADIQIRNTGVITLRDMQPSMGICLILDKERAKVIKQTMCSGPLASRLAPVNWHRRSLRMDEPFSFSMNDVFQFPDNAVGYAEISIATSYRIWFWPWRRTFEFKLITRKQNDGTLVWLHEPLE